MQFIFHSFLCLQSYIRVIVIGTVANCHSACLEFVSHNGDADLADVDIVYSAQDNADLFFSSSPSVYRTLLHSFLDGSDYKKS